MKQLPPQIPLQSRFKAAGMQLLHGNFGNAVKALTISSNTIDSSTYRGGSFFFGYKGEEIFFDFDNSKGCLKAYKECSPVFSIITQKATALSNGQLWVLDTEGKNTDKESVSPAAKAFRKLWKRPNFFQSGKQLESQIYTNIQIHGYAVLLPIVPVGYDVTDAKSLWCIPSHLLNITWKTGYSFLEATSLSECISSISLTAAGITTHLDPSLLIFLTDTTASVDIVGFPTSRLEPNEQQIDNIIGAYGARKSLLYSRGALGLLTPETDGDMGALPVTTADKEELQKDFSKYGIQGNQWKVIIANTPMKWQQMGFATKDLMLFEEIEDDVRKICDSYGFRYELLSNGNSSSMNGTENDSYRKQLYENTIIPEATSLYDQLTIAFGFDKYNLRLDKDFSKLSVLQEDEGKKAEARLKRNQACMIEFNNNVITLNQWRILNGDDPISGDDKYRYELEAEGRTFANSSTIQTTSNATDRQQ